MKAFTLRDIPLTLHQNWKIRAAKKGMAMKDYCYLALQKQIDRDNEHTSTKEKKNGL